MFRKRKIFLSSFHFILSPLSSFFSRFIRFSFVF